MEQCNGEAVVICKEIMSNELKNKDLAIELKEFWIASNIIPVDATYSEVANDSVLVKTLLWHLASGLSQDPKESRYGNQIISYSDLYFNRTTDKQLNDIINKLNNSLTCEDGVQLKKEKKQFGWIRKKMLQRSSCCSIASCIGYFELFCCLLYTSPSPRD